MLSPGLPLLFGLLMAGGARAGCVEVASGTEAVLGLPFRLLCIACKRRSETPAEAAAEWFFRGEGDDAFHKILQYSPEEGQWVAPGPFLPVLSWNGSRGTRDLQDLSILQYSPEEGQWVAPGPFLPVLSWNGSRGTRDLQDLSILQYSPEEGQWVAPGPFLPVLSWNGSRGTRDLQDLSVRLAAVGRAHAGRYVCRLRRNLTFDGYVYSTARNQSLSLSVVDSARRDLASIVSEILMYVMIVVLTLWLAAEMLYCYRKVAAAAPPPDSASEYLAITSESKENCAGVQVAE